VLVAKSRTKCLNRQDAEGAKGVLSGPGPVRGREGGQPPRRGSAKTGSLEPRFTSSGLSGRKLRPLMILASTIVSGRSPRPDSPDPGRVRKDIIPHRGFRLARAFGGTKSGNHHSAPDDDFPMRTIEEPGRELDVLARETIGAAIEVHRALGPGFLESIYEEALCLELTHRNISFARQVPIPICYRSHPVGTSQLDLMVGGQLVVELKAVSQILPIHVAQVISYLKAAGKPLGLLLNFHVPVLHAGIKRVILSATDAQTHR